MKTMYRNHHEMRTMAANTAVNGSILSVILWTVLCTGSASNDAIYYKLSAATLRQPGWPRNYSKYDVLIADPGLENETLSIIRKAMPNASLVVYTCMSWVYTSQPCTNCTGATCTGCPSSRCIDTTDSSGKSYWNHSWNVQNLHDGKAVCPFGGLRHEVTPVATWIPQKNSVEAMARFHVEKTVVGYDGIYVDDFMPTYYGAWETYIEGITAAPGSMEQCLRNHSASSPAACHSHFSIDGHGTNASVADLQAQYAAWKPYYTAQLRQALGTDKIIIANVPAPATPDPNLNGITVEFEHCRGDENPHETTEHDTFIADNVPALSYVCEQTLLGQQALTSLQTDLRHQSIFALWLTHSEVIPAQVQCQELAAIRQQFPWIREGDDITDCTREGGPATCVHCNVSLPS
eukprot:m.177753 g.177753  ORF g.177753 m.177753 type:complete len:405 (+) comp18380_c0_seq3:414-1628(+)